MAVDNLYSYDSFAKLNIMSETKTDGSPVVPQIMFDLAKNGSKCTWNGDRLAITYNSGVNASVFRISEVTGTYRDKLNFELLGSNNIYYGTVKGTSNNSFIFSRNNSISDNSFDNNWINSDGNSLFATGTSGINFIDSNNNLLASGYLHHRFSSYFQKAPMDEEYHRGQKEQYILPLLMQGKHYANTAKFIEF